MLPSTVTQSEDRVMHRRRWTSLTGKTARILFIGILISGLSAKEGGNRRRVGLPQDWTHHHIKFHTGELRQHPEIASHEARAAFELYREAREGESSRRGRSINSSTNHRDWSVNLGTGRVQRLWPAGLVELPRQLHYRLRRFWPQCRRCYRTYRTS